MKGLGMDISKIEDKLNIWDLGMIRSGLISGETPSIHASVGAAADRDGIRTSKLEIIDAHKRMADSVCRACPLFISQNLP